VLDAQEDSPKENPDGLVEALNLHGLDGACGARDPGVVEHAVEPAIGLNSPRHEDLDVAFPANVRVEILGSSPELLRQLPAFVVLNVSYENGGPFLDE